MEEMMVMMEDHESHTNPTTTLTTPSPSWKLYQNPFFYSQDPLPQRQFHFQRKQHPDQEEQQQQQQQQHRLQSSHPTPRPDITIYPPMNSDKKSLSLSTHLISSELEDARTQIEELKAEIEYERRIRRKAELTSKRLAREASEERKARQGAERVCGELAEEIVSNRAEIERMRREMEEERKMLRIAEVWREERVQMKLADARVLLEEKVVVREEKATDTEGSFGIKETNVGSFGNSGSASSWEKLRPTNQRRGSPEAENPHIRRGIKGFVEFPRVVRAMGSRERQMGSKVECQKAQLRIFLRQKNPVGLAVGGPDTINLLVG